MQIANKNYDRWSSSDDQQLTEMVISGFSSSQIARSLGRTRAAVWARKNKLGISLRTRHSSAGSAVPVSIGTKNKRTPTTPDLFNQPQEKPQEKPQTPIQQTRMAIGIDGAIQSAIRIAKANGIQVAVLIFDGRTNG